MKLPSLKFRPKTPHLSLNVILTLSLAVVLGFEIYIGLHYFYGSQAQPATVPGGDNIVRVDKASYKSIIDKLNDRVYFSPTNPIPYNPNPFK